MTDLFPRVFETERLRFERVQPETLDARELYPYVSSESGIAEATQYMTWDPHAHPRETMEYVSHVGDANDAAESGNYALYPKLGEDGAGEFAGNAGLSPDWDRRTAEFGIWLRKPFWGRGYSGERADAFVELAFARLGLDAVTVTVVDDNDRSVRAIEKYVDRWGGRHDGHFRHLRTHGDDPVTLHRYSIARNHYETAGVDVDLIVVE
ncbi:GNAT family N-acetyltransferase [Halorubellus sp. JP-L1]|uniref:GNAT family N-acetyltransferase n=1 Tax=Halorubellus sp. JP-L1 TaxID=2715753 RepID=UPI00140D416C|nr:GNAT family N-acetyltransferase [Halorubellus sp. JP-L1]